MVVYSFLMGPNEPTSRGSANGLLSYEYFIYYWDERFIPVGPENDRNRYNADLPFPVTGGSGAIGLTVAAACLESGADVICFDWQNRAANSHLQGKFERVIHAARENRAKWFTKTLNVTAESTFRQEFARSFENLRYPLRGLVTCAGISGEQAAIDCSGDFAKLIFDINYNGSLYAAQAAARCFHEQDVPGSIVLVASMSGSIVNRGLPTTAYNSSKAAVQQLARSLAAEWGRSELPPGLRVKATHHPPIRVNSLSPGHVRTPITAEALAKGDEKSWADGSMLGRIAEAEEMRGPVLFLLSDASSYVTGLDLRVDGGTCSW